MAGKYEDGSGKRGRAEYPDAFICADCKVDYEARWLDTKKGTHPSTPMERRELKLLTFAPIDYMLQGSLWEWAVRQMPRIDSKSTLCLDCVEKRLRRPLHPADFTPFPINLENPILQERRMLECLIIGPYT